MLQYHKYKQRNPIMISESHSRGHVVIYTQVFVLDPHVEYTASVWFISCYTSYVQHET